MPHDLRRNAALALLGLLLGSVSLACDRPVLSVDDAIVTTDGKTTLAARLVREKVLGVRRDVTGIPVAFYIDSQQVGAAHTDADGRAQLRASLHDAAHDRFTATSELDGRMLRTQGCIFPWRKDRITIAVDIDETISQTDYEELILRSRDGASDPFHGANRALRALAEDFQILYLTARPRFLLEKTRRWLAEHDFPPGPVFTAPGLRQAVRQSRFKSRVLARLRAEWPHLLIGIGDREGDADAYGANGMLTLIIHKSPESDHGLHSVYFKSWKDIAEFFDANRELLTDADMLRDVIAGKRMIVRPVLPYGVDD